MNDRNYLVFAGDGRGRIEMSVGDAPPVLLFAADEPGIRSFRVPGRIAKPSDRRVSDLVKFSGITRFRVHFDALDGTGCEEDTIDANRQCRDLEIVVDDLWSAKKYCGTVKGESQNVAIKVAKQHGHGGEVDWDYGNFSDQGNRPTTGCSLEVWTADELLVTVRLLSADPVRYLNAPAQRYKTTRRNQGWFYPVYNFFKDLLAFFRVKI